MGTVNSKNTRRISFENRLTMSSALAAKAISLEDENILDLADIAAMEREKPQKFKDNVKSINFEEAGGREMDYWASRLDKLKREHREINKVIENEYQKTLEISNQLMEKPRMPEGIAQKLRPCYDYRKMILQCYEENAHQPLVCSPIVRAFTDCVKSCQDENIMYT